MGLFTNRKRPQLPAAVRGALDLGPGERILAWDDETAAGDAIVATNHRLVVVSPEDAVTLSRPWHEVEAGTWNPETGKLIITWADRARPLRLALEPTSVLLRVVRERVQASVIATKDIMIEARRRGRAALRQDLAGGPVIEQFIPARGVDPLDPVISEASRSALADLRDSIGL